MTFPSLTQKTRVNDGFIIQKRKTLQENYSAKITIKIKLNNYDKQRSKCLFMLL